MADNNKVTIDAAWFAELWKIANEADKVCEDCVREKCGECKVVKERDELKAKLSTSQNYEAVIAAKDREIEGVKEERNRLNAKVNELKAKLDGECKTCVSQDEAKVLAESLAAAERCIEEVSKWIGEPNWLVDSRASNVIRNIIRAYREKKDATQ